jgi:hypothetical protein
MLTVAATAPEVAGMRGAPVRTLSRISVKMSSALRESGNGRQSTKASAKAGRGVRRRL